MVLMDVAIERAAMHVLAKKRDLGIRLCAGLITSMLTVPCWGVHHQVLKVRWAVKNCIDKAMTHVARYVESWKRHSSIWKSDKVVLLEKFKAKSPSNLEFEKLLAKYTKVGWRGPAEPCMPYMKMHLHALLASSLSD
jgi:hypothetical protein